MTELPHTRSLDLVREGGWLTIWLNRPESRNALSAEMVTELRSVLDAIAPDRSIRGVTLRGRGGMFSAGGDLKGFAAILAGDLDRAAVEAMSREGGELFQRLHALPQATVALVEGAAVAGGLGLAACADFVVATRDAAFALTETTLGIVPAQIAPMIVDRIGVAAALRLMLSGQRFDGTRALELGLVERTVDTAAGLEAAEADIRSSVLRCAPGANALTKRLLLALRGASGAETLELAATAFADAVLSDEGKEGISSFAEKRKPDWAG